MDAKEEKNPTAIGETKELSETATFCECEEKINAVQRMQEYIMEHYQENIRLPDLARAAAYSPWHALRAFSELIGKTPFEYLRAVRVSAAAMKLRDTDTQILDIALESAFGTQEGFSKAFSREFGITPGKYRKETPAIPLFSYYPVCQQYKQERKVNTMSNSIIFTRTIEYPKRKFILRRGQHAADYFAYCEEVGCDVWGILESIKGALQEPMGVWLPANLRTPGTSEYCQGVEVPTDFIGSIPDDYEIITLPACTYMIFQSEPYEDENFDEAIENVWNAIERYNPHNFGWEWAPNDGPRFQFAPIGERGYIEGRPVSEYRPEKRR